MPITVPHQGHGHSVSTPPAGNPGAWFSADSYPADALRRGAQGRTVAQLQIDPTGKVVGCSISVSSGDGSLDAATCRIATGDGRFTPARDESGRPIASTYRLPVRWVLPEDAPAPAPVDAAVPESEPRHQRGWFARLGEAHHVLTAGTAIVALLASKLRRLLGWGRFSDAGMEIAPDVFRPPSRWTRLRAGRFGSAIQVAAVIAPLVAVALALA